MGPHSTHIQECVCVCVGGGGGGMESVFIINNYFLFKVIYSTVLSCVCAGGGGGGGVSLKMFIFNNYYNTQFNSIDY